MNLTDLSHIYVFLPLCMLVFYLLPAPRRVVGLFVISLLYCAVTLTNSLPLLIASVLIDYCALLLILRFSNSRMRWMCLLLAAGKSIAIIAFTATLTQTHRTDLTLGVLVYTLSGFQCLLSTFRKESKPDANFFRFALHCFFFPKLYAGPISLYADNQKHATAPQSTTSFLTEGFWRFSVGAFKVLLPGRYMRDLFQILQSYIPAEISTVSSWLMVLSLALYVYYYYSGFCDMAQGIGGLFGMKLPQNFYYPYQSRTVSDFVLRFNSTVWLYLRHIISAKKYEDNPALNTVGLLVCGMLAGVWFGFSLNYVVWGLYIAFFLILEQYLYGKILARIPTLFTRVYTFAIVLVGFCMFAGGSLEQSFGYLYNLFDFRGLVFINNQARQLLINRGLILALSCFFATNIFGIAALQLKKYLPRVYSVAASLLGICLLALATATQIS